LSLRTSGVALLGPDHRFDLPLTFSVHYPLIDRFFPPARNPNAPGDAPKPFQETFTGVLSGTLYFDAPDADWHFVTGDALHLAVTGTATGKVLAIDLPVESFELVADTVSADRAATEQCPEGNRCKERTLKICPIRIRAGSTDTSPTGTSMGSQLEKAKQVWRQCCIEILVQGTQTVTAAGLKQIDAPGPNDDFSAEEIALFQRVDKSDCVEVYFFDRYDPRHAGGDGVTQNGGTASCKVAVADDGNATDSVLLAHEMGHCLGLDHPDPADGSVMDPTGQEPPNPPGQGSFVVPREKCADIRQPLLRATRRDCCKASCDGTDHVLPTCRASVSGDTLSVRVQDLESGLRTVEVINENNTSYDKGDRVRGFINGSTQELGFTVDKTNPELPSSISFRVTDVCGNSLQCDPILTLAVRDSGRPATQTLAGVAAEEALLLVVNQTPGLRELRVSVNGTPFHLGGLRDGEQRTLDLSAALRSGTQNVVTLTGHGQPGGSAMVMLHD
jgi:hypothetical protein